MAHGSESGVSMQERLKPFVEAIKQPVRFNRQNRPRWRWPRHYRASVKVNGRKTAKEVIKH